MKKMLSALLIGCIISLPCAAAFTDISSSEVRRAADSLNSLGIMNGVGNNRFAPNDDLTRSQFCKLAVVALGTTDVSAYQNYTIFPDVKNSHWASGYINAAVKKHSIIKGLPDGTFSPNKALTYGEACTMLLNMLGYTIEDIGPFWPDDYIAKAESLKICDGIDISSPKAIVTRGQAAIMLRNILTVNKKEGDILLRTAFNNVSEDRILLSTYETDSDLDFGQIKFYDGSETEIFTMSDNVPTSLIGARGYVVFDNVSKTKVKGFLPETKDSKTFTVKKAYADKIETTTGTIKPSSSTSVILGGEKLEYSNSWFDIVKDQEINVYYSAAGKIELIAVNAQLGSGSSFVYGTTTSNLNIPSSYTIVKNGIESTTSDIKKYDVVTIDDANKKVIVSDKKITARYMEASPSFKHPSSITVLGKKYDISDNVASSFASLTYKDNVTLLLDSYDNVVAAYPATEVSQQMLGVITKLEGKNAEISFVNGDKITSAVLENDSPSDVFGKLVAISQSQNGKYYALTQSATKVNKDWNIDKGAIGEYKVIPNVKIYEQHSSSSPITEIDQDDITLSTVKSSSINGVIMDSSNNVTAIILNNVTGESLNYGIVYTSSEKDEYDSGNLGPIVNYTYTVTLHSSKNEKLTYNVTSLPTNIRHNVPVGISKGLENNTGKQYIDVVKLLNLGTVTLDDFNTSKGVMTANGYYLLADDIQVYIPEYEKHISLREAKANFTSFTLYADKNAENGGKIRSIVAR